MEEGKENEPPAKRRFSSSSSQDLRTAVEATVAENTRKANDQWLRCFQQYCAEKKISIDLCSSSVEEIASVLERNLKSLNSYDGPSNSVKREISARLDQAAAGLAVAKVNSAASEAQVGTSPQFFFQSSSSQITKEITQTTQAKPVFDLFAPNAAFEGCTFIFKGKGR